MSDEPAPDNQKRKKAMWITFGIFAVIGLAYLGYWFFYSRFYEYTDDAYVDGNLIYLTPQVPGIVTDLTADNSDFVLKGRVLVELDKTDAIIALNLRTAELGLAVREVCGMFEKVKELAAQITVKKAALIQAVQDYEHRQALIDEGAVSIEDLEHAIAALQEAFGSLNAVEHQYIEALAQVENTTVENHPKVAKAQEILRSSYVNLQRCTLLSPVTGIVAQRSAQVGKQVQVGTPLLAVIPLDQMWATANFKEIQLSQMRVGQPVNVTADLWGDGIVFRGKVVGIGGGTGSVFSVLPPQNATGNWIKIVQRIPVKIALHPEEIKQYPLRLGLSLECTVDIRDTQQPMIPATPSNRPLYETDVLSCQEEGVEELIQQVIQANLSPTFIEDFSR